ncbi:AbrB/MazE/SpoVT family DNA-binding domain-containing protein [Deinococcus sp. D7000]|nr:AbrB/MazE/SpoVT family DNA-binding domain-containing protein [Deinococcus sp. D7000]
MTTARKVTATLSSKAQLTLPRAVRERLGVDRGDSVEFTLDEHGVHLLPLRRGDNPFLTWLARTPVPAAPAQASAYAREARHAGLDPQERQLLQAGPGARVLRLSDLDAPDAAEPAP